MQAVACAQSGSNRLQSASAVIPVSFNGPNDCGANTIRVANPARREHRHEKKQKWCYHIYQMLKITKKDSKMTKNKIIAVLTFAIFLSGTSAVSAEDGVSLCEYWHGDPTWTCGFAFIYSDAAKNSCKMQFTGGFPHWLDRDISSLDVDALNDDQIERLENWKQNAGHFCKCNVKIQCGWVKVSSNGWVAVPSPQISNHECAATPDTLGTMRYHQGQMTPSC